MFIFELKLPAVCLHTASGTKFLLLLYVSESITMSGMFQRCLMFIQVMYEQ